MNFSSELLFSLIYNGPTLVLALVWLLFRVRDKSELTLLTGLVDAFIVAVGASRFLGATIPPSGHTTFLTYSLITVKSKAYRVIALLVLLPTIGLKISWKDYTSWAFGLAVGIACAAIWMYTSRRPDRAAPLQTG